MANLFTGSLDFEGYKTLSSLTGITFVQGTTYTIQIQNFPSTNNKLLSMYFCLVVLIIIRKIQ